MTNRDQVVSDLVALWPHLNWAERWSWIERIRPLFGGVFAVAAFTVIIEIEKNEEGGEYEDTTHEVRHLQ